MPLAARPAADAADLDPAVSTGWDVAALTDAVSEYQGSCGG